jgi:hypothetical protein
VGRPWAGSESPVFGGPARRNVQSEARGAHEMPDPQRELEEQEPDELSEEELGWDADAWEEEDLEGLDEEQSGLDARVKRMDARVEVIA